MSKHLTKLLTRQYILDNIDLSDYTAHHYPSDNLKLLKVYDIFNLEYGHKAIRKRYPNEELRCTKWLMGLPSTVDFDFARDKIIEIGYNWQCLDGDSTPSKVGKFVNTFQNRLAVTLLQMVKKAKKDCAKSGKDLVKIYIDAHETRDCRNTYHTVYIQVDKKDETKYYKSKSTYGYERQYIITAGQVLSELKLIKPNQVLLSVDVIRELSLDNTIIDITPIIIKLDHKGLETLKEKYKLVVPKR